jgi:rod shape determining protein RodA
LHTSARLWRHFDVGLLAAVALLTIAGIAMIRSAIGGNENLAELVPRQAIYAVIGLVIVFVTATIDYRLWSAVARPMYLLILVGLGFILAAGFVGFGSARWFNVGIVLIQPSELSKIVMIIVLADYMARHQHEISDLRVILRSLALAGVPFLLVFLQPDLSTSIVIGVIWLALIWAAGAGLRQLAALGGVVLVAALVALPFVGRYFLTDYSAERDFLFIKHYQMARVANFLFPDPEAHYGASYNVNQSLISIGSGGLFGQGYGNGSQVQLRFLKVRHTDFIFSAMSEEFGFVGAVSFLLMLMYVIYRCLRAAALARDMYGALICYGVAVLLMFQGSFNVGMNLNLLPVSGLPLPFFSYGGSSLVASLIGIGLVESVVLRHKRIEL